MNSFRFYESPETEVMETIIDGMVCASGGSVIAQAGKNDTGYTAETCPYHKH